MKLIFLYGPPAVGKYTVGKELEKLTGFKLFHNHATVDAVHTVFKFGTKPFWELVEKYRTDMIKQAVKYNVDLIFTSVYVKSDAAGLMRYVRLIERNGGKVLCVRLYTPKNVLHKRLKGESRKKFGKVKESKTLNELFRKYELYDEFPHKNSMSVDNTNRSAKTVARMIIKHYHLPIKRT
jgi:shikimate kinase